MTGELCNNTLSNPSGRLIRVHRYWIFKAVVKFVRAKNSNIQFDSSPWWAWLSFPCWSIKLPNYSMHGHFCHSGLKLWWMHAVGVLQSSQPALTGSKSCFPLATNINRVATHLLPAEQWPIWLRSLLEIIIFLLELHHHKSSPSTTSIMMRQKK